MATSSSTADARALSASVLSWARAIAAPTSDISSTSPVVASPIRTCASAAEYWALTTSFCVRKASTFADSRALLVDQLLLLLPPAPRPAVEALQLALDQDLALQRRARQVLAAAGHRLAGLTVELDHAGLELRRSASAAASSR